MVFSSTATQYSEPMASTPIHGFRPTDLPGFDETLTLQALSASYLLYDAGARSSRIAEARALATAAGAAADAVRQQVAFRAGASYAAVLSDAAMLEAHDARLRALNAEQDRVRQFESVGRAAHVEMLRVEAALAAAEAERIETAAALDEEERALARLTGMPVEQCRSSNLEPFDAAAGAVPSREEIERHVDTPAMRQARAQAAAAQAATGAAKSTNRPQVAGTASELFYGNERSIIENNWNAGLALRYSFFDGGATAARVERARAAASAAEAQVRASELETSMAIDRGLSQVARTRAAVGSLRKAVERYAEVARIEKLRLDNGAGTQTDYLRAEADLVAARASLAAAQYRTAVALLDLARVTGQLDSAWLASAFRSDR